MDTRIAEVRVRGLICLLATLAVVSCVRSLPVDPLVRVQLETPFTLRVGQTAIFEGAPIRLHFVRVDEDSRCPVDVDCVWAGDARVHVILTRPDLSEEALELHTFLEPRATLMDGYRVSLERLEPAPHSERRITQREYAAEFRIVPVP